MSDDDPIKVLRAAAAAQKKLRNSEQAYHRHAARLEKSVHSVISGASEQRGDSGPLVRVLPEKSLKQSQ